MVAVIRGPRLVILGRQGAGKGTQGQQLVAHLGIHHLSTGAILRQEVAQGSALGRRVQDLMNAGRLVPDALMLEIVSEQLSSPEIERRGFLLDGFPRTVAQAEGLMAQLGSHALDAVLHLDVPLSVVRRRLGARRVCTRCETPTVARHREHTVYCSHCGGTAVRRPDDTPEAIDRRLAAYEEQAGPLLAFFERRRLVITVDSVGAPEDVAERVMRSLRPVLWGTGEAVS